MVCLWEGLVATPVSYFGRQRRAHVNGSYFNDTP